MIAYETTPHKRPNDTEINNYRSMDGDGATMSKINLIKKNSHRDIFSGLSKIWRKGHSPSISIAKKCHVSRDIFVF